MLHSMIMRANSESIAHVGNKRLGDICVEAISADVALWNVNRHSLDPEETVTTYQERGAVAANSIVDKALKTGTVGNLFDTSKNDLDPEEAMAIIQSSLSRVAQRRLKELERGTEFDVRRKRVVVTVASNGVEINTAIGDPLHGYFVRRKREAQVGESFAGRVEAFRSSPPFGGYLQLGKLFGPLIIRGLVNPTTGKPQITLDIFERLKS